MNPDLTRAPTTDPAQIIRYRDRQYAAELLAVALLHLDFFSWLDQHPGASTETLQKQFQLASRPCDVLLTLLRANGFIVSAQNSHQLTSLAQEHLVKGAPHFLGPYYAPIADTPIVQDYLNVLSSGKPANWQAHDDGADWHASMLDDSFARDFTALMHCRGLLFGQKLAQALASQLTDRTHLLDVGGGSGIYAATMVAAHPHLRATVLEQAPVDAIARKEIDQHGLADHLTVHTADMFAAPWPKAADVILFSNVLHDWDVSEVHRLIEQAADTLPSGGLLVIHEVFINDDKNGPIPAAEYSALLMCITQGKCYTHAEYANLLDAAGFDVGPYQDTVADRGYMTAVKR